MRETTMRSQFIRYGVLCALLAWTSPVEAGGGCTDEKFQRHSKHALEAYNRGDYETALVHYDKAYQCQRKPIVLFNQGQAARKAKRYREALTFFRRYLDDEPTPNPAIREELQQHVQQLERMVRDAEQLRQMADAEGRPAGADATPGTRIDPQTGPVNPEAAAAVGVVKSMPLPGKDTLTPIYKKPWFWGAVGGGAAALAVITGVSIWAAQRPKLAADYGTPRPLSSASALMFHFGGTL